MEIQFPLFVANWKMHKTVAETKEHLKRLLPLVFRQKAGVWIAVPYTDIAAASQLVKNSKILIGAQNMSDLAAGAFTGEVSAPMLLEAGASFVVLGHSERRKFFFEENALINRKIKLALRSNIHVILCIGESKEEKEANKTALVLEQQMKECLKDVPFEMAPKVLIAYEPIWAIGTSHPAPIEIVEEIHTLCKNYLANYWGIAPNLCPILYGGSVNVTNAGSFLKSHVVDGLLVGAASLDVLSFTEIIHQA